MVGGYGDGGMEGDVFRFAGIGLVGLLAIGVWIYCIFDVIATEETLIRNLSRGLWLVLVIFLPTIGSVAWLALGRPLEAGATWLTVTKVNPQSTAEFEPYPPGVQFYVVLGNDSRDPEGIGLGDAIKVIGVNTDARAATIINIPRDTYIGIPGRGQARINEAHVGGNAPLMAEALRSFTGAPVKYLITTNFAGFEGVVDAMHGVSVDIPYDIFDSSSGANFPKGRKILSGSQALAVARARKSVPGGDFGRTQNQGLLLLSGLRQVQKSEPGPAQTIRMVGILLQHIKTSSGVTPGDLYNLARLALTVPPNRIANITMPGTTGDAGGASVVFPAGNYRQVFADFADDAIVRG